MSDIEILQQIADLAWLWNTNRIGDQKLALEVTKLIPEYCYEDAAMRLPVDAPDGDSK